MSDSCQVRTQIINCLVSSLTWVKNCQLETRSSSLEFLHSWQKSFLTHIKKSTSMFYENGTFSANVKNLKIDGKVDIIKEFKMSDNQVEGSAQVIFKPFLLIISSPSVFLFVIQRITWQLRILLNNLILDLLKYIILIVILLDNKSLLK